MSILLPPGPPPPPPVNYLLYLSDSRRKFMVKPDEKLPSDTGSSSCMGVNDHKRHGTVFADALKRVKSCVEILVHGVQGGLEKLQS